MNDKKNDLSVRKVKRLKNGGLSVEFVEHVKKEDGIINVDWSTKNEAVPHPDLSSLIFDLKRYLASCCGMLDIEMVMKAKGMQAGAKEGFKKVKTIIDKMVSDRLSKLEITGYSVSGSIDGEKDKRGVVISGTFTQANGAKISINSPFIKFNQDQFKFESDIKVIIDNLEDEITGYINGEKRLQQEMKLAS